MTNTWRIVHQLPGRIRIQYPALRSDPSLARRIQDSLSALPTIQEVRINTITGSILIYHQEGLASARTLAKYLPPAAPVNPEMRSENTTPVGDREPAARKKFAQKQKEESSQWSLNLARKLRHLAYDTDAVIKTVTGGRLELRQVVLTGLLARAAGTAVLSGPLSWAAIQAETVFVVAWTLYHNPDTEQELQKAKDIASPAP